ncbi:MAG: hypothetical protein Kow00106_00100 [Anaerolineae bacterium]
MRVQTTDIATQTDAEGRFVLAVSGQGPFKLTAWAEGYFCAGPVEANLGETGVELLLAAHNTEDNPDYPWLPSRNYAGLGESQRCAECHSAAGTELTFTLPVDEWQLDAHSQSAVNPRFLTMYLGTDINGNASPPTRYVSVKDYGLRPLRPDPNQPYYGPGYKLDFPDTAGNCAACHTPAAAVSAAYDTDPTQLSGVVAEGVPCDFCHKVWAVNLDPTSGLPYANMPGVLSLELRRPPDGHQFFAGPLDDVAPGEDTYSPLQTESVFCAPCHFGVFWGTVVYNSYGEWLASPYSEPASGRTCQDCHMPRLGATHFALPEKGGLARNPQTIFSHYMPGAADTTLLQNTADLTLRAEQQDALLTVTVAVTNAQAGHHIPTDSPLRQIFVIVSATDAQGLPLTLQSGPVLPDWTGNLEGQPGVYFAKILQETWTEIMPSGAYWNPTRIMEDTRLPALATHTSTYTFHAPGSGPFTVGARLIFRRAFYDLMQRKGWNVPDLIMEETSVEVPG